MASAIFTPTMTSAAVSFPGTGTGAALGGGAGAACGSAADMAIIPAPIKLAAMPGWFWAMMVVLFIVIAVILVAADKPGGGGGECTPGHTFACPDTWTLANGDLLTPTPDAATGAFARRECDANSSPFAWLVQPKTQGPGRCNVECGASRFPHW